MKQRQCQAIAATVEQVQILTATHPGSAYQVGIILSNADDPTWVETFALTAEEARRLAEGMDRAFAAIERLQSQN